MSPAPAHAHKPQSRRRPSSHLNAQHTADNQTYFSALITILISKAVRINNLTAYG